MALGQDTAGPEKGDGGKAEGPVQDTALKQAVCEEEKVTYLHCY